MAVTATSSKPTLGQLLPEFSGFASDTFPVGRLVLDSRKIENGDCFVALVGANADGTEFIDAAIARGAQMVMQDADAFGVSAGAASVPCVSVPNLPHRLSQLAGRWFNEPSEKMTVVAITGTNGKTTSSQWLAQLLNSDVAPCASLGTLGFGLVGEPLVETGLTTPDAISTQSILSQLHLRGAKAVVMEASSHSLEQGRAAGVDIDVAVFTNIGRDHLDYHGDIESYVAAKTTLMTYPSLKSAVINNDDEYASSFTNVLSDEIAVTTFGLESRADVSVANVNYLSAGIEADICYQGKSWPISLPIWGDFNLSNVLAVVAAAIALGEDMSDIQAKLSSLKSVPGRLQTVGDCSDIRVLVDFAHTADALESVLKAVRAHSENKLWCVFGCGGDRDKGKRPLMAAVAERVADRVVLTSDNPRSENAEEILSDILSGFKQPQSAIVNADRRLAIDCAIEQAAPGDCIVIAGKGHEQYQLIGDQELYFCDVTVAESALQNRKNKVRAQ